MWRPVQGPPLAGIEYWCSSKKEHIAVLLSGSVWRAGTILTFATANYVGIALAGVIGRQIL